MLRVSGSHHIYGKSGSVVRLSIPIHANRPLKFGLLRHLDLAPGTLNSILKQAGLKEKK